MSNLADGESITLRQGEHIFEEQHIRQYMMQQGYVDLQELDLTNENRNKESYTMGKCYVGLKTIDYYGKKRGIVGIFITTDKTTEIYDKMVIDKLNMYSDNPYNKLVSKIYDQLDINKIKKFFAEYEMGYCYWISGKGIAGGIAGEIASKIKQDNEKIDMYCYTFGSPRTGFMISKNAIVYEEPVHNIINEDDYLTKAITAEEGYRQGYIYNGSIYLQYLEDYKKLTKNIPAYEGNYMKTNSINHAIFEATSKVVNRDYSLDILENINEDIAKMLGKYIGNDTTNENDFSWMKENLIKSPYTIEVLNKFNGKAVETAASVEAYWTLAKMLDGFSEKSLNESIGKTFNRREEEYTATPSYKHSKFVGVIEDLGRWYVDNVYTYLVGNYGGDRTDTNYDISKSRTELRKGQIRYDATGVVYLQDEQLYQDEFKHRFEYHYNKSSEMAKKRREKNFNEKKKNNIIFANADHKDIMKFYDVTDYSISTPSLLNVDLLKEFEVVDFDGRMNSKERAHRGRYYTDKIKVPKNKREQYFADDCSSFVSAVLYKYISEVIGDKEYKYDPFLGTSQFSINGNPILDTIGKWFICYEQKDANEQNKADEQKNTGDANELTENTKALENAYPLQAGDIMVTTGHVEFYLDDEHSFGWGDTHNSFSNNPDSKVFRWKPIIISTNSEAGNKKNKNEDKGGYFYDASGKDTRQYTKVYRLREEFAW